MAALSAVLAFRVDDVAEYSYDAGPAIRALINGDVAGFFENQPLMGSFSLLLRAPFALLSKLGDGSDLLAYRLGAVPCVLAAGLLGLYLARLLARRGRSRLLCVLVAAVCVVNPVTFDALALGHPEELLTAALCVGATLAATRGRTMVAAILLGLALASKQWALVAVPPVLLAASTARLRIVVVSALTAALLTLPMVIGHPAGFSETTRQARSTPSIVGPWNLWWPLVPTEDRVIFEGTPSEKVVTVRAAPSWLREFTHPAIVLLPVGLSLLFWWRRRDPTPDDALTLLALFFLLRAVLDPVNNSYYHAPLILTLLALETFTMRRLPVLSAIALAAVWASFHGVVPTLDHALINAFYLAWALPLAGWLALRAFAPGVLEAKRERWGLSPPLPSR
jgi:hypothetical protein